MKKVALTELAHVIRSKNSGPFELLTSSLRMTLHLHWPSTRESLPLPSLRAFTKSLKKKSWGSSNIPRLKQLKLPLSGPAPPALWGKPMSMALSSMLPC